MKLVVRLVLADALAVVAIAAFGPVAKAASCESLASLKLPDTTITTAESVAAGAFTPPGGGGRGKAGKGDPNAAFKDVPAFCRIAATLKPTSDSDIKIEVWMPATGWNGKFQANGNGGFSGSITPATLANVVKAGYAAGMTDTGHDGGSAQFAMGHPEKAIDFAYRSEHELTLKAKALVAAFYGNGPKLSYWVGCSAGGRQALMEAQRYPEDYDGVIAGSPGLNWSGRAIQSLWIAQATHKDEASFVPAAKFQVIHQAAVSSCDMLDGVKDGVLEDPTKCKWDPKEIQCKDADGPTCLSAAQVETVRKIYSAAMRTSAKTPIFSGHERGSELGWNTMAGQNAFGTGVDYFKYVIFQKPDWDWKTLNFDDDVAQAEKIENDRMNARNGDLKKFIEHGGKLIQYHGWSDPQISPGSSTNYYGHVKAETKGVKIEDSYRLFMIPGMAHCGGGEGTSSFDMVSALEQWRENNKAPDMILAAKIEGGKTVRTRPLCPFPQTAVYKGSGSTDEAANFSCAAPPARTASK